MYERMAGTHEADIASWGTKSWDRLPVERDAHPLMKSCFDGMPCGIDAAAGHGTISPCGLASSWVSLRHGQNVSCAR